MRSLVIVKLCWGVTVTRLFWQTGQETTKRRRTVPCLLTLSPQTGQETKRRRRTVPCLLKVCYNYRQ